MKKKQLIKNSTVGLVQFILTSILIFISIPVFINKLGLELYGVFALVSVIGNLNLLTNLGLNNALVVFVASQGKTQESDHDIAVTQIILISLLSVIVFVIIYFREFIITNLFSVPHQHIFQASKLLVYLTIANAFLIIGQAFTSVLDAMQKNYLTSISLFVYSLIYWVGLITIISFGGNLASIGLMALIAAIIWFILVYVIYRKLWKKLNLTGLKKDFKRIAWKQISYGSKIYATGMISFMFEPLSKILLSNFIGINIVALFEIGVKIRGQLNGIIFKILYPLFPFIAESKNDSVLKNKIFDLSKKILLIVIPSVVAFSFIVAILIRIWLGVENWKEISIFTITLTATMLLLSTPILPIYHYLTAKNLAGKTIWMQLFAAIINIVVFLVFYRIFDFYTILVSNSLAFLGAHVLGTYYQIKYLNINIRNELSYYFKISIYAVFTLIICLIFNYFIPIGIWDIILYPTIVSISFIYFVRWMKLISISDLEHYFETLPKLKSKLSKILIA